MMKEEYSNIFVTRENGVDSFFWVGKSRRLIVSDGILKEYQDGDDYHIGHYRLAYLRREGIVDQYVVFVRKDSPLWFFDVIRYRGGIWLRRKAARYILRPLYKWICGTEILK